MNTKTITRNQKGQALISLTAVLAVLVILLSTAVNSDFGNYYIRGGASSLIGGMDVSGVVNPEHQLFGGYIKSDGQHDLQAQSSYNFEQNFFRVKMEHASNSANDWIKPTQKDTCVYTKTYSDSDISKDSIIKPPEEGQPWTQYTLYVYLYQLGQSVSYVSGSCTADSNAKKTLCGQLTNTYLIGRKDPTVLYCFAGKNPDTGKLQAMISEGYFIPRLTPLKINF